MRKIECVAWVALVASLLSMGCGGRTSRAARERPVSVARERNIASEAPATTATTSAPGDAYQPTPAEPPMARPGLGEMRAGRRAAVNHDASGYEGSRSLMAPGYEASPRPTAEARLSTFSTDVDTASYGNLRRVLSEGRLPDPSMVRIEEMLNYFDYDYPEPSSGETIALRAEVGECPWNRDHRLLHVGIRARDIESFRTPARNIVLLVDVSGSMSTPDKLPLVQAGFERFVRSFGARDRVAIVVYAGSEGLALPSTAGNETATIVDAIRSLRAAGSTNGSAGIELAYREARRGFVQGGVNRVVLATDGDFNAGITDRGELVRLIETQRASGVFLTVLGVGQGNLRDDVMEAIADHGNGNYAYLDSVDEATNVLVRESSSTLATVAADVKVQVEMNPRMVASHRLVGYEDRALSNADFHDEQADAGELGAGHTVTALYEFTPTANGPAVDDSIVGSFFRGAPSRDDELASISVRFRDLRSSSTREVVVRPSAVPRALERTTDDFRFAAAVAELGLLLRHSAYAGGASYSSALSLARGAIAGDASGHKRELAHLIQVAGTLSLGNQTWSATREPEYRYGNAIDY